MINNYPLLERARSLQAQKATGLLALSSPEPGGEAIIACFYDGFIEAVFSDRDENRLGQYLVRRNLATESDLQNLLKRAREQRVPLGEILVNEKIVEPHVLKSVLGEQAVDLFRKALESRFRIDSFESKAKGFKFPLRMSADQLLLDFLRRQSAALDLDGRAVISLNRRNELESLAWTPSEIAILSQLRYPRTLGELAGATDLKEEDIRQMLGVFQDLGIIQIGDGQASPIMALTRRERLPLEALIPKIHNPSLSDKLEVVHNHHSFTSEQFNSLKVQLAQLETESTVSLINVTSPGSQDGKSLVAANLAFCFSKDPGRRVLLMDCDLRVPAVDRYLGITREPGLVNFLLQGNLDPQCFIRRIQNLFILTAGGVAENPVALLSLSRMKRLIEFLREEFDTVIIDSPPLIPIADARVVSNLADASLLVIRRGKTPYSQIEKALRSLDRRRIAGVVFNDVKPTLFDTYHSYNYYSHPSRQVYPEVIEMERKPGGSSSPLQGIR